MEINKIKLSNSFLTILISSVSFVMFSCSANISSTSADTNIVSFSESAQSLKQKVDNIFEPKIKSGQNVGIIVGIIQGKEKHFFGYGSINKNKKIPPNEKTMFHIASITKVFTTSLLSDMVVNNSVKFSDNISKYLPESVKTPKFKDQEITLALLSTHLSGLPNAPADLNNVNYNPYAPYMNYKVTDLYNFISNFELTQDNDKHKGFGYYEYSNLGTGLLGHILSKKLGMTYEEAIKTKICEPLGLKNTVITLSTEQKSRLATGYLKYNNKDLELDISGADTTEALAGSFALKSDAEDLLKFVEANLEQSTSKLKPAFNFGQKEPVPGFGIGWDYPSFQTKQGKKLIWKNGAWTATGVSSFIGFIKETNTGVVILYNTYDPLNPAGSFNDGTKLINSL